MNIRFPHSVWHGLAAIVLAPCLSSAQLPAAGLLQPKATYVAAGLASNKGATDPQPNTVVFDCPKGDGRHGAKGILLKAAPGTAGSTWSFKYIRNHEGEGSLQIIHPVGAGQAVVIIRAKEIRVDAPKTWSEMGWGGGETKPVNEKAPFKEVFPLKDDQEYNVVSRMTAGGSFSLFFDGELVATGHVSGARPLSLKPPSDTKDPGKFSGPDLPLVWSPGWAGLICGPVDRTRNEVANLQFTPAIIEMPGAR